MLMREIPLTNIVKTENFRRSENDDVADLMTSIKKVGLLQPVIVKPAQKGKYELLAGYRRTSAFRKLKKKSIKAIVMDKSASKTLINLTENIQRKDATAYDIGRGFYEMINSEGMSKAEVAAYYEATRA